MKAKFLVPAVAGTLMLGGAVGDVSAQDVLKEKGCLACHDATKKKMGPALKDIAAKYKGDSAAEATLTGKLKDAKGHPKVNAGEAEIKAAVQQILATK